MNTTIRDVLRRAAKLRPEFSFMIAQLHPVPTPRSGAITSDRYMRLYYDPFLFEDWELDWCAARVLVQIEHYYRRHSLRQRGREEVTWSVAAEIVVTDDLIGEGIKMHPDTLQPEDFDLPDGLSVEEAATRLFVMCQNRKEDIRAFLEELTGLELPLINSAASEDLQDWEHPEDADIPAVDFLLALMEHQENPGVETIPGTTAGNALRGTSETRASEVDWRVEFFGLVGSTLSTRPGADDYSYAMPDPDAVGNGLIMPGMVQRQAVIAIVVDTSSSMGEGRIAHALAEIDKILHHFRARDNGAVYVYSCDVAVHCSREVFHLRQLQLVGGGGTAIGVGIKAASEQKPRPDMIVCLTDGDTPWPKKGVGIPVVVVLINAMRKKKTPRWVHRTIRIGK